MSKLRFLMILCLIILWGSVNAQGPQMSMKGKSVNIPFRVTSFNNIIVNTLLNEVDSVQLMFHTAASDVYITDSSRIRLKSFRADGKVDSVKSWGGGNNSSEFSEKNRMSAGDISWTNITIWGDKNSGQESDGKFGINLFDKKVLAINFDRNEIVVSERLPRNIRKYQKFKIQFNNDAMYINAICKVGTDTFSNWFMVHSGYSGSVLLDDKFSADHKLSQRIEITGEKKLQDAYGNVVITKKALMPTFIIGGKELANVAVGFFEGSIGRQKVSVIGGEIIKRFNWIVDAKREYVYLRVAG